MTRLEDELRAALQREEPPVGFADRVLALAASRKRNLWVRLTDAFAVPRLRWATAVIAVLVMASGVGIRIQEQRRAEGEAAKRQVMLALRITSEKWQVAAKEISGKDTRIDQSHRDTENPE
jgi:hypothetical protein